MDFDVSPLAGPPTQLALTPDEARRAGLLWLEYWPLSLVVAHRFPINPKDHDIGAMLGSVERFGYTNPCLFDEGTGRFLAGHGRMETLETRRDQGEPPPGRVIARDGDWWIPVVRGIDFADPGEALAYLVADNRQTVLGGWLEDALADALQLVHDATGTLEGTGYDGEDLDRLLAASLVGPAADPAGDGESDPAADADGDDPGGEEPTGNAVKVTVGSFRWLVHNDHYARWLAELEEKLGSDDDEVIVAELRRRLGV